jgi:transcriptional regulator with XRE-family HTH domain
MDIRELRKTLAGNIKKQRRILGLTQEKLAEIADISSNMINDIEGCRTWVSDKTILKLAAALHVEVYQLLLPRATSDTEHAGIHQEVLLQLKRTIDAEFAAILEQAQLPHAETQGKRMRNDLTQGRRDAEEENQE